MLVETFARAPEKQSEKYKDTPGMYCNADMSSQCSKKFYHSTGRRQSVESGNGKIKTVRAYNRILKVSKTIRSWGK